MNVSVYQTFFGLDSIFYVYDFLRQIKSSFINLSEIESQQISLNEKLIIMAYFAQYKKALYGPNPPLPHNCQILLHNGEKELAHKNILAAESIFFENALFFSNDDSPEVVFKGMKEVCIMISSVFL